MKLLRYILLEKYINISASEMANPREPAALWQLYRHLSFPVLRGVA